MIGSDINLNWENNLNPNLSNSWTNIENKNQETFFMKHCHVKFISLVHFKNIKYY